MDDKLQGKLMKRDLQHAAPSHVRVQVQAGLAAGAAHCSKFKADGPLICMAGPGACLMNCMINDLS